MKTSRKQRRNVSILAIAAATLLFCFLMGDIVQAQVCDNTCQATLTGPRQGRHTADASADAVLWPPNHKFRTVTISASNEQQDDCNVTITNVTQDEPVDGPGSGNTSPDAANCSNTGNNSSLSLRSERAGTNGTDEGGMGTGRYYHIDYTMDDSDCPNMPKSGTALILVPHDQGVSHLGSWIDEGPMFSSGATCNP